MTLTDEQKTKIAALADEKYRTWEWNYGRSPAFTVSSGNTVLSARHGVIESSTVYADLLVGRRLIPEEIKAALSSCPEQKVAAVLELLFD